LLQKNYHIVPLFLFFLFIFPLSGFVLSKTKKIKQKDEPKKKKESTFDLKNPGEREMVG